ncbi:hypothetical protein Poli38472_000836 [Pythium oligandrum]|uniref:VTT domain-containing protein n=1 Tax=Pythium oligandrum TaxID=41045 RepID=A0A8K1FH94_PYTOL|nr:hypothetical protein Poli38472_000836 [Pythium oligandrum]|eukprot:TMW60794.1 hypothetical protein Poli38472_000836 [Pythium oligandrum]
MTSEVERLLHAQEDAIQTPRRLARRWSLSPTTTKRVKITAYVALAVIVVVAVTVLFPIKQILVATTTWVEEHHLSGACIIPLIFCIAVPLAIPVTVLEILGGSAFGVFFGVMLNLFGKTCGALTAFLLGKRLGKERLGGYLQANFPVFTALAAVIESANWKPLVLIQLSSLPPVVKFYGLAVMDVSVLRFIVSAIIGGIPGAILWAYVGFHTKDLLVSDGSAAASDHTKASSYAMVVFGLICTVVAMVSLFFYTRRELQAQLDLASKKSAVDPDYDDESTVLVSQASSCDAHYGTKHRSSMDALLV